MRMHGPIALVSSLRRTAVPSLLLLAAVTVTGCHTMSGNANNIAGRAYYRHGNYVAAQEAFQRAAYDDPRNPDYSHNLAAAARKQGDYATAERMYQHAINVNPMHQPSYHQLAAMYREQGRDGEAVETIASWAGTQPYNAQAHIEHAWIQSETGDVAAAEQSLRQALRIHPNHPTALAQLGQVYETQGNGHMAAGMYRRSLAQAWDQPQLHRRLATLPGGRHQFGAGPYGSRALATTMPPTLAGTTFGPTTFATHPAPHHHAAVGHQPPLAPPATFAPESFVSHPAEYVPDPPAPYETTAEPGPSLATQPRLLGPPETVQTSPDVPPLPYTGSAPSAPAHTTPISSLPTVQPF